MLPLAVDLYCGLGGWAEGCLAEGYRVRGYDIEAHDYGTGGYPGELILADVLKLHGRDCADADVIVGSSPCTEYSYMAMPWSRSKQIAKALRGEGEFPEGYTGSKTIEQLNALFNAQFRIQREACEAAGRYIPMVVENVRGAQPWVGRAKANFGSYYLWGDVGMVGRRVVAGVPRFGVSVQANNSRKNGGGSWFAIAHNTESGHSQNPVNGLKLPGNNSARIWAERRVARLCDALQPNDAFYLAGSNSDSRKSASAMIAKIPFPLAAYIARSFKPGGGEPRP